MVQHLQERRDALAVLAKACVPEWRFSPENPDAGTTIALLIDDMLAESEARIGRAMEKYHIEYLNLFDRLITTTTEAASSYVRFTPVAGVEEPVYIPKRTRLLASGDVGEQFAFETTHAITTTPSQVVSIFVADPETDRIVCLREKAGGEAQQTFTAFDLSGENKAQHMMLLGFDDALIGLDSPVFELVLNTADPDDQQSALNVLLKEAQFSLLEPDGEFPLTVVEKTLRGIRLKAPAYFPQQVELEGEMRYVLCVRMENPPDMELTGASLALEGENLPPDEVLCGDVIQNPGRFLPFGAPMEIYAECNIECKEVLNRRGADVTLRFHLDFETNEQMLPEMTEDLNYKIIMKRPPPKRLTEFLEVRADQVFLEYRSERGWRRILQDEHATLLFNGSARGELELRFQLPRDIVNEDGESRLRFRLMRADNLYAIPSVQLCPVISSLSFSYQCEGRALLPNYACTSNNFEVVDITGRIHAQRIFTPFYCREEIGTAMYFGFDQNPQGMPLSLYFELENDEDEPLHYIVEYASEQGFSPIQAVDHTGGLLHPGTLLLPVPSDCALLRMFGQSCYWIRMVLRGVLPRTLPLVRRILLNMAQVENLCSHTEHFYVTDLDAPLVLELARRDLTSIEVYVNEEGDDEANWVRWGRGTGRGQRGRYCEIDSVAGTVRFPAHIFASYRPRLDGAAIRVDYRSCQGEQANVPPERISVLENTIRRISLVSNPVAAFGGYDGSGQQAVAESVANLLSTRGRAVTESDYLNIIRQTSHSVRRIKCVSGVDQRGNPAPGTVTIAMLIEQYRDGGHIFPTIRERVQETLAQIGGLSAQGKTLLLTKPDFVRFSVRIWLDCGPEQDPYELQRCTQEDLDAFLDPLNGGLECAGWEIGELPTARLLLARLKVRHPDLRITRVMMLAKAGEREYIVDEDIARVLNNPFVMAVSGRHTVYVGMPGGGR